MYEVYAHKYLLKSHCRDQAFYAILSHAQFSISCDPVVWPRDQTCFASWQIQNHLRVHMDMLDPSLESRWVTNITNNRASVLSVCLPSDGSGCHSALRVQEVLNPGIPGLTIYSHRTIL